MKKLLLLQLIIFVFTFEVSATEEEIVNHINSPTALRNFAEDKSIINEYLDRVKDAQLHFFWTTGRTISDNPDYGPINNVEVGGLKYGKKFFPYVDGLLSNSSDKLKIIFVCDKMTIKSNEQQIISIQSRYKDRFEIVQIGVIHRNLLKTFSDEEQVNKINVLFKNATQGSPVISSDVYRIIGMIYGQDNPSDPIETLRAYCDIDAFCYGMETSRHGDLIKALFMPIPKSPFYFGRSHNNNDIIKICISDMSSYKVLCNRILKKININRIIFPGYNIKSVIWHYSDLHDMIKKCEENTTYCLDIPFIIPDPIYNLIEEVTQNTGPKFLYDNQITTDLSYPSETVGAWGAPEEVLDHNRQGNYTSPPSVLDWGYGSETLEEKEASDKFTKDCDIYRKYLGVYFYAKQFGENHPFNIEIKKYLLDNYPYSSESFKSLLKENFKLHNKYINQSYELYLMEDFPSESKYLKEGEMYVEREGDDKINFFAIPSDGEVIKGTLDISIDGSLNRAANKRQILKETLKLGITRRPKRGLSYEEWREKAFSEITNNRPQGHYTVLNNLLKKVGIELRMTPEFIHF